MNCDKESKRYLIKARRLRRVSFLLSVMWVFLIFGCAFLFYESINRGSIFGSIFAFVLGAFSVFGFAAMRRDHEERIAKYMSYAQDWRDIGSGQEGLRRVLERMDEEGP